VLLVTFKRDFSLKLLWNVVTDFISTLWKMMRFCGCHLLIFVTVSTMSHQNVLHWRTLCDDCHVLCVRFAELRNNSFPVPVHSSYEVRALVRDFPEAIKTLIVRVKWMFCAFPEYFRVLYKFITDKELFSIRVHIVTWLATWLPISELLKESQKSPRVQELAFLPPAAFRNWAAT